MRIPLFPAVTPIVALLAFWCAAEVVTHYNTAKVFYQLASTAGSASPWRSAVANVPGILLFSALTIGLLCQFDWARGVLCVVTAYRVLIALTPWGDWWRNADEYVAAARLVYAPTALTAVVFLLTWTLRFRDEVRLPWLQRFWPPKVAPAAKVRDGLWCSQMEILFSCAVYVVGDFGRGIAALPVNGPWGPSSGVYQQQTRHRGVRRVARLSVVNERSRSFRLEPIPDGRIGTGHVGVVIDGRRVDGARTDIAEELPELPAVLSSGRVETPELRGCGNDARVPRGVAVICVRFERICGVFRIVDDHGVERGLMLELDREYEANLA